MTVKWIFSESFACLDILIHSHCTALAWFLHMTTPVTLRDLNISSRRSCKKLGGIQKDIAWESERRQKVISWQKYLKDVKTRSFSDSNYWQGSVSRTDKKLRLRYIDETEFTLAIIHATDWSINRLADCLMTACTMVPRTLERFFPLMFFSPFVPAYFSLSKPVLPELNCNANPPITYYIFEKARYFPGKMRTIYSNSNVATWRYLEITPLWFACFLKRNRLVQFFYVVHNRWSAIILL